MDDLLERLRQLERRLGTPDHASALAELDALKTGQPTDPAVARLWCLVALRTGKTRGVASYVERCLPHSRNAVEQATLCWMAGQAQHQRLQFEAALPWLQRSASLLRALLLRGELPSPLPARPPRPAFADGRAESQMWQAAAALRAAGSSAFPSAGTLLALVREGRLFAADKDLDFAVWIEDLDAAARTLAPLGWQQWRSRIPYTSLATFVHQDSGLTIDMAGWRRDAPGRRVVGGYWLADQPEHHQRILDFPWIELVSRASPAGEVNWPADPDALLTALYGDWRRPVPWFDTVISARNLRRPSLQVRNFAYIRLIGFWLRGDLERTRDYAEQCRAACPDDGFLAALTDELQQFQPESRRAPPPLGGPQ